MDSLKTFQLHELILLILGAILFLVVVIKLISEKNLKNISKNVIILLILSVAMIGFSAVSKLSFQGFVVELNHQAEEVVKNPTEENIKKFTASYAKLNNNKVQLISPDKLLNIANALHKTGRNDEAQRTLTQVIEKKPASEEAKTLKLKIDNSLALRRVPGTLRPLSIVRPTPVATQTR